MIVKHGKTIEPSDFSIGPGNDVTYTDTDSLEQNGIKGYQTPGLLGPFIFHYSPGLDATVILRVEQICFSNSRSNVSATNSRFTTLHRGCHIALFSHRVFDPLGKCTPCCFSYYMYLRLNVDELLNTG